MNLLVSLIAILSILVGAVSMVTPIPGGTILIAGGLTVLICSSPTAQFCVMWIRARVSWFNRLIAWLQQKVGVRVKVIGLALSKTQPPENLISGMSHREFVEKQLDKRI